MLNSQYAPHLHCFSFAFEKKHSILRTRQFTLTGPHVARYFAVSMVARRLNYRSASQKYIFLLITLIPVMLIYIKVKLFYSFHNDNSYTQIDPNVIKT